MPREKDLLAYLASLPSTWNLNPAHIAAHYGVSKNTVYSWLAKLREKGAIKRVDSRGYGGRWKCEYYVNIGVETQENEPTSDFQPVTVFRDTQDMDIRKVRKKEKKDYCATPVSSAHPAGGNNVFSEVKEEREAEEAIGRKEKAEDHESLPAQTRQSSPEPVIEEPPVTAVEVVSVESTPMPLECHQLNDRVEAASLTAEEKILLPKLSKEERKKTASFKHLAKSAVKNCIAKEEESHQPQPVSPPPIVRAQSKPVIHKFLLNKPFSDHAKTCMSRYPEDNVIEAVQFVYDKDTPVRNSDFDRMLLAQDVLKNPDRYKKKLEDFKNHKGQKRSPRHILKEFHCGKKYNGYEYTCDAYGVTFLHPNGVNSKVFKYSNVFFEEDIRRYLRLINVPIPDDS